MRQIGWDKFFLSLMAALLVSWVLDVTVYTWLHLNGMTWSLLNGSLGSLWLSTNTYVNDKEENSRRTIPYSLSASACMALVIVSLAMKDFCWSRWFCFGGFIVWIGILRPITTIYGVNPLRDMYIKPLQRGLHVLGWIFLFTAFVLRITIG